jgi:ankyrin repeat protein
LYAAHRCLQALADGTYLQYYALINWPKHIRSLGGLLPDLIKQETSFFEERSAIRDSWWRKYSYNFRGAPNEPPPRLHVACYLGIETLVRFILQDLESSGSGLIDHLNEKCLSGWSPLDYVTESGCSITEKLLLQSGPVNEWWNAIHESFVRRADLAEYSKRIVILLNYGADINARDRFGRWPLQYAIATKHKPIVELILARGAGDSARYMTPWEPGGPVRDAIATGDISLVQLVLAHGASPQTPDADGMTPIRYLMGREPNDLGIIRLLLEHGAMLDASMNRYLLLRTLLERHYDFMEWLLAHGACPNIYNETGQDILHIAHRSGLDLFVELLLKHGADSNRPDSKGNLLLHLEARAQGRLRLMRLLLSSTTCVNLKNLAGDTALHAAIRRGDDALVKIQLLIDHGADPSCSNSNGDTPLHLAAKTGPRPDLTTLLLESKVDVNARDSNGNTALHIALLNLERPKEVMQVLLAHHANPNIRNFNGNSSLHLAFLERRMTPAGHFVDEDADLEVENMPIKLRIAAESGECDVARVLTGCGADVNALSPDGYTVLHIAALKGNLMVAELLCDCGIDVDARDKIGWTALHYATSKRDSGMVKLLFNKGAKLDARDSNGQTAVHLATVKQDPVRMRLLLSLGAQPILQDGTESTAPISHALPEGCARPQD